MRLLSLDQEVEFLDPLVLERPITQIEKLDLKLLRFTRRVVIGTKRIARHYQGSVNFADAALNQSKVLRGGHGKK